MLASVAVSSVNQAVPLAGTRVHGVVLLASTEETLNIQKQHVKKQQQLFYYIKLNSVLFPPPSYLAALAGDDSIVDSRGLVPTDLTGDDLDLSCRDRKTVMVKTDFHGWEYCDKSHSAQWPRKVNHSCALK